MYEIRTYQPYKNRFYIRKASGGINPCVQGNITQDYADALANCVGYACGRYAESYYQATGEEKMLPLSCNAKKMLDRAKDLGLAISNDESNIPTGSLVVFDGTYYGHILFVEKKIDSDNSLCSESNYSGTPFVSKVRTHSQNWGFGKGLKYLGHILPLVDMVQAEQPKFIIGKNYTTLYNLRVRVGAGLEYRQKATGELTKNAQKVANRNGCIKADVLVTCLETKEDGDGNTWVRIPSGWVVGILDGDECLR